MKPSVKYADVFGSPQPDRWLARFDELRTLPAGTKLCAGKREFRLIHAWGNGDGHPPRLELSERIGHQVQGYQCRQGDALIFDLRTLRATRCCWSCRPNRPGSSTNKSFHIDF